MTNGEMIQKVFKGCEVCEPIPEEDIIHVIFSDKNDSAIGFDWSWWNAEYKEPNKSEIPTGSTTKNNLAVDCISRADALDCVNWGYSFSDIYKKINELPSVTPQEQILDKINKMKSEITDSLEFWDYSPNNNPLARDMLETLTNFWGDMKEDKE